MKTDFRLLAEQLERVYSPRLALRQVALCDAWPLHEATRNPGFNRYLLWAQPDSVDQTLSRVGSIVAAARKGQLAAVAAVYRATGEWASLFRFQPYAANPAWIEMGIWTSDRFWHGKYSFEITRMCIDAAFSVSDIAILVGAASPLNRASCRLMELCGMSAGPLVYRRNEAGVDVQLQEFVIHRTEWAAGSPGARHARVPGGDIPSVPPAPAMPNGEPVRPIVVSRRGVAQPDDAVAAAGGSRLPVLEVLDGYRA